MRRFLGIVLLLTLLSPPLAQAQDTLRVNPGDRVRVTSAECFQESKTLRFSSFTGDTLWISTGTQEVGWATSEITMLEVFRPTPIWKTSAIGLLAGVAAGVLFMEVIQSTEQCSWPFDCSFPTDLHVRGGLVAGAVGLLAGVSFGVHKRSGGWEEVPLPLVQPCFSPSLDGRLNLGFSIPLRR